MVKAVGCDIETGDLALYELKKSYFPHSADNLEVRGLGPNGINSIEKFFQQVSTKINGIIDCFCVLMDSSYKNRFRKKFIRICKTQKNIKNVRIISFAETKLLGAIENLSFLPETGDCLCIFDCRKDIIYFDSWNFNEEQHWVYMQYQSEGKTFKEWDKPPILEDLLILNSELKILPKIPYIYVLHNCVINENDFKSVFPDYQKIMFNRNSNCAGWALIYARYFLNDEKYVKYKSDMILDRSLEIKKMDFAYFEIHEEQVLPFSNTINKVFSTNDIIKFYEDEIQTEIIVIKEGRNSITLEIDLNGIYTIKVVNLDKINETNAYKEIEFYFIPKKLYDFDNQKHAVGIDLGTTECCAAVIRKNGPDFVVLDPVTGLRTMPSYIAFDERKPKCGQIVIDRMKYKAEYTVYDSKRIIGKKFDEIVVDTLWPFSLIQVPNNILLKIKTNDGVDTKSPEEISAILLKHIKRTIEVYEGRVLTEAVITIPSEFSEKQKQATKKAAEMAGWETIHFIPEPVAAAFAYFSEIYIPDNSRILICDCGGGTTDICVANVIDEKLEILSFDGDSHLGGRDFDKLLFNHFSAILKHKYNFDLMKITKKFVLKQKCQDIKHKLSVTGEDWLDVDDFDSNINEEIKLSKAEFEEMSSNFMLKMKDVILRAALNASLPLKSIDYVFQVGGGCRMPMIKQMLKEMFPNAKHECNLYPDWVVAHGAALYAYHLKTRK